MLKCRIQEFSKKPFSGFGNRIGGVGGMTAPIMLMSHSQGATKETNSWCTYVGNSQLRPSTARAKRSYKMCRMNQV